MKYLFDVPDISCNHCKMHIEKALSKVSDIKSFTVDVQGKKVEVVSELPDTIIANLLDDAGYPGKLLKSE